MESNEQSGEQNPEEMPEDSAGKETAVQKTDGDSRPGEGTRVALFLPNMLLGPAGQVAAAT